jgi:hypothetical protein
MASTSEPASPLPSGVIPDFDNPQDTLYTALMANAGLCVCLTTIFVFCRFVARGASEETVLKHMVRFKFLLLTVVLCYRLIIYCMAAKSCA